MSRGSEAFMGSDEESWPQFLVNLPDQSKYSMVSQPKGFTGEQLQERDQDPMTPLVNMRPSQQIRRLDRFDDRSPAENLYEGGSPTD